MSLKQNMIVPIELNSVFDVPDVNHFFFDMFGVLWSGSELYPNVDKVMIRLRELGKKVYILSNQTILREKFIAVRNGQGLVKGIHYDDVVTSGEVCYHAFENKLPERLTGKQDYRVFVLGTHNPELFSNTASHLTDTIENADMIYISSIADNSTEIFENVFIPAMQYAIDKGLPAVCANPDVYVIQSSRKVFAQGVAAKWYALHGGKLVLFGKPDVETYEFALSYTGATVHDSVMVGDMLVTDIWGANRAGMRSILVLKTGMTGYDLNNRQQSLNDYIIQSAREEQTSESDLTPTYTLPFVGVLPSDE